MKTLPHRQNTVVGPVADAGWPKPVRFWAALGAGFLGLQAWIFGSWLLSGDLEATPVGPTPIPTWMQTTIRVWEVLGIVFLVALVSWFLIRPWRHERRLTLDGMFLLGCAAVYWQDPLLNYSGGYWGLYNSGFINWGSWLGHVPGVLSQNASQMVEPVIWAGSGYIWFVFYGTILTVHAMRAAKRRWPTLSPLRLVLFTFGVAAVLDTVLEVFFLRLGLFHYPGATRGFTLFHGRYYQFPLYEAVLWGGCWTVLASFRYFVDDKGQTIAERGVDDLPCRSSRKTGRALAVIGAINAIVLGGYNIPSQYFSTHADYFPDDVQQRSYLTNMLCGPGTDYACAGPGIPNARPDAVHLTPDGKLSVPEGTDPRLAPPR